MSQMKVKNQVNFQRVRRLTEKADAMKREIAERQEILKQEHVGGYYESYQITYDGRTSVV